MTPEAVRSWFIAVLMALGFAALYTVVGKIILFVVEVFTW